MPKTNVKTYTRNGHIVKAYDRSIKDRIIQAGAALGGISGAAIGYKRGGILGAGKGLLAGAAIGSLPGAFTPSNREDSKKAAIGLSVLGVLGAGILSAKYGKNLLRGSSKLASYNPLTAERNSVLANNIKLNTQAKIQSQTAPRTLAELNNSLGFTEEKHLNLFNTNLNNFFKNLERKSNLGMLDNRLKRLDFFEKNLPLKERQFVLATERIKTLNKLPTTDFREDYYRAVTENSQVIFKDNSALKNYQAIVKAIDDPKIGSSERKAYEAQLSRYKSAIDPQKTIDRFKEIGFTELDIKELKDKFGSNGLFSSYNKLATFARKKGSKDKTKRKLRDAALVAGVTLGTLGLVASPYIAKIIKKKIQTKQLINQIEKNVDEIKEIKPPKIKLDIPTIDSSKVVSNIKKKGFMKYNGNLNGVKNKTERIKLRKGYIVDAYKTSKLRISSNDKYINALKNNSLSSLSPTERKKAAKLISELSSNAKKNQFDRELNYSQSNKLITFARKKGSKDKKKRVSKVGALIRAAALPTIGSLGGTVLASKLATPGAIRFVSTHIKEIDPKVLNIAIRPITGVAGALGGYVGYKGLGELNKATINKNEYYTLRSKDKKYRVKSVTPENHLVRSLTSPITYIFG